MIVDILNVRKQVLEINAFTTLKWRDPQLVWNVSEFDGISKHVMSANLVWTPDVVLLNTADDRPLVHTELYRTKVKITNGGDITWTSPTIWKVSCSCDITWFPVDQQKCPMRFGSWTNSESLLKLIADSRLNETKHLIGSKLLVGSGEWKLSGSQVYQHNSTFRGFDEGYSIITIELNLQRMPLYYLLYIIMPLVALMLVFALVFHLDSGQRASYGVTILLSITVYLLVISEKLPEKSDNYPFLGICFIAEFFLLCVALSFAEYSVHLSRKCHAVSIPKILKFIVAYNKIFFHKREEVIAKDELPEEEKKYRSTISKQFYQQKWKKLGRFFDAILTFVYIVFLVLIPLFVGVGLMNHEGK